MKPLSLLSLLALAACAVPQPDASTPRTVAGVDLQRYAGTWHEAARFPQSFQDSARLRCEETTATYTPRLDGKLDVLNSCANALVEGRPRREVRGTAYAVEGSNNARLRVSFFGPFYGDYWVIGLDPDYRWAVVGTPDRNSLWFLSRQARMAPADFAAAEAVARREGFDLSRLQVAA
ncbi:lipocalin family protein [Sabulicella rubraurantiaca]|uniref:lipocalin family protein n=1 Tax=Sabulicella rubraurantiaca TaxID=2811429 RepID=UPI001A977FF0|nr:lipocalin family protein [Sabulicella rubraurantiaca]